MGRYCSEYKGNNLGRTVAQRGLASATTRSPNLTKAKSGLGDDRHQSMEDKQHEHDFWVPFYPPQKKGSLNLTLMGLPKETSERQALVASLGTPRLTPTSSI